MTTSIANLEKQLNTLDLNIKEKLIDIKKIKDSSIFKEYKDNILSDKSKYFDTICAYGDLDIATKALNDAVTDVKKINDKINNHKGAYFTEYQKKNSEANITFKKMNNEKKEAISRRKKIENDYKITKATFNDIMKVSKKVYQTNLIKKDLDELQNLKLKKKNISAKKTAQKKAEKEIAKIKSKNINNVSDSEEDIEITKFHNDIKTNNTKSKKTKNKSNKNKYINKAYNSEEDIVTITSESDTSN